MSPLSPRKAELHCVCSHAEAAALYRRKFLNLERCCVHQKNAGGDTGVAENLRLISIV
jgi:hypothetical protein